MKRTDFEHSVVLDQMSFDSASAYPTGDGIYFECKLCGDVVGWRPVDASECSCGNLVLDADAGTLNPRHGHGTVLVFHARPRPA
ncbi:MAG: hypothetical protein EHM59_05815 [Betaproteobacteria bacterium]|nr:MAG: hypothetical protein EHM59_05815 [Betaproteobacteria bacterium]